MGVVSTPFHSPLGLMSAYKKLLVHMLPRTVTGVANFKWKAAFTSYINMHVSSFMVFADNPGLNGLVFVSATVGPVSLS